MEEKNDVIIKTSVLIVGGGIQGLALLNLLSEHNISALLVSNSAIGSGQSICNHGYFHNGYIFGSIEAQNWEYTKLWPNDLLASKIKREKNCLFAASKQTFDFFQNLWQKANKEYEVIQTPSEYQHGSAHSMIFAKINDFTFDKRELIHELRKKVEDKILFANITSIRPIPFTPENHNNDHDHNNNEEQETIWESVLFNGKSSIRIMSKGLALCAGIANYKLANMITRSSNLSSASSSSSSSLNDNQVQRNQENKYQVANDLHILAVKGPSNILPNQSLVCWELQLMIASHQLDNDETIYYISSFIDDQKKRIDVENENLSVFQSSNGNDDDGDDEDRVLQSIITSCVKSLFKLIPTSQTNRHSLQFFAYTCWKSNHPQFPNDHHIPFFLEIGNNGVIISPDIVPNIFENSHRALSIFQNLKEFRAPKNTLICEKKDEVIQSFLNLEVAELPEKNAFISYEKFALKYMINDFSHL